MLLNRLKPNPKNPRILKKDEFERLKKKIKSFPEMLEKRPIVYDGDIVLGGNQRLQVLKELVKEGFEIKDNYFADASSWSDEQKRQFVITDNISDGNWDYDVLANEWDDLPLEEWGINTSGWGNIEEDEAPELQEGEPDSKLGELYQLGRHRLMCGDATNIDNVDKLMDGKKADMVFTDPPYGVDYDGGTTKRDKLIGDKDVSLYQPSLANCVVVTKEKAPFYIWFNDLESKDVFDAVFDVGLTIRSLLMWVKNHAQFGALSAQYKQKHEPLIYAFKKGKTPNWYGAKSEVTVWEYDRASKNEYHPTQKPVALTARAIKNSSKQDDIVLDIFGGSGSTLIAAEQTNRICYMMELDPKYCDVIIKRYDNFVKEV